ncbi:MAG TPA: hypothetical protein VK476_06255 [Flavobacterium sp.]|nr:hypothetical protein [Flavobacterium sp.]
MKKLIAVITLLFAVTISAQAQDKKLTVEQAAKNDVAALVQKVTISESLKSDMYTLMIMKHESLSDETLTEAQRKNISEVFQHKVMSGLTPEQARTVSSDPQLLKQISN